MNSGSSSTLELCIQQEYIRSSSRSDDKNFYCISTADILSTVIMPHRKIHPHYESIFDLFERGRVIGLKEVGWADRRMARQCWQKWLNNSRFMHQNGSNRWRSAIEWEYRTIVRLHWIRHLSTIQHVIHTQESNMATDMCQREQNLCSHQPSCCLPLTLYIIF